MKMMEFKALDDQRWRCTRRRNWLIGAMFWAGMTLGIMSSFNGACALLEWPRMPHWSTMGMVVSAVLSMLLFHINQRRLDRIDARMDEALKGALGYGEERG